MGSSKVGEVNYDCIHASLSTRGTTVQPSQKVTLVRLGKSSHTMDLVHTRILFVKMFENFFLRGATTCCQNWKQKTKKQKGKSQAWDPGCFFTTDFLYLGNKILTKTTLFHPNKTTFPIFTRQRNRNRNRNQIWYDPEIKSHEQTHFITIIICLLAWLEGNIPNKTGPRNQKRPWKTWSYFFNFLTAKAKQEPKKTALISSFAS